MIGTLVSAIGISLTIFSAASFLKSGYAYLRYRLAVRGGRGRCFKLTSRNVPPGRIHDCSQSAPLSYACIHGPEHVREKKCWESDTSIATAYNVAWWQFLTNPSYSHKPRELVHLGEFFCVDARTILAFVLFTAEDVRTDSVAPTVVPSSMKYWSSVVDLISYKGHLIAHVEGVVPSHRQGFKFSELAAIPQGYPPFYRT